MALETPGYREFQSTLPVWGGTVIDSKIASDSSISIHPPRVGRDFNAFHRLAWADLFQSTLPVWGGTLDTCII